MEEVPLANIAAQSGTPFHVYSTRALQQAYLAYDKAFSGKDALICFAVKANCNPAVIKTLGALGAGADVVSVGELLQARRVGIPASKIVFSGVGKTRHEMKEALRQDIFQINIESESELRLLDQVAQELGKVAQIAIRVNPDVEPETHAKIATGHGETKFGVPWDAVMDMYQLAANLPGINAVGVAVHIGSQITTLGPFEKAFAKVVELVDALRRFGHNIRRIDFGGGIGIDYENETLPNIDNYAKMVLKLTEQLKCKLIFEPGRFLAGPAGALVTQVIHIKKAPGKTFAIIDAGMNDFMRPALYDARHRILPLKKAAGATQPFTVVGPVCETTCSFGDDIQLPADLQAGDFLAIMATGAYGSVLGSTYNMRLPAPEIMVSGDRFTLVRRRPTYEEINQFYRLPVWS
jgi:diaminopimelate decarboxylase